MKRNILIVIAILTIQNSIGQQLDSADLNNEQKYIKWDKDRKLTWTDFKGKAPNTNDNVAAMTSLDFIVESKSNSRDKEAKVFIQNIFSTKESWVKKNSRNVPGLLEHEQGHFDLGEIYARKLRKRIANNPDKNKIMEYVEQAYESLHKIQDLYDKETVHSIDKVRQKEWLLKIAKELNELEKYRK